MEESKLKEIAKVQTSTKGVSFADFNTYVEEMHEQTGRPTDSYLVSESFPSAHVALTVE